jgi:hypothetical protein
MISNGEKDKLRRQLLELRPVMAESEESGRPCLLPEMCRGESGELFEETAFNCYQTAS